MSRRVVLSAGAALGLALAAAVFSAPASFVPPVHAQEPEPEWPKWKAGEQEGTVEIDGATEAFVALVPKGYTPKKAWPVVLLAHGNGGKAADFLRTVKTFAGKKPPLLVSLERCDNNQDAVGYVPKYLDALSRQFRLDERNLYALGFSGGGFRLWDDVVCKAAEVGRFRGVVLVGCGKQSFDPPERPEPAATVVLVGDPKDGNFTEAGPGARKGLEERGYEVLVHEHAAGHSLPPKEMKAVFEWIGKRIDRTDEERPQPERAPGK